ncbi:hypothetical protein HDU92_004684 [Lobulomyces angularis]|nr:hypothetical protein HDU92_004684 [Lobulomyces angularis]
MQSLVHHHPPLSIDYYSENKNSLTNGEKLSHSQIHNNSSNNISSYNDLNNGDFLESEEDLGLEDDYGLRIISNTATNSSLIQNNSQIQIIDNNHKSNQQNLEVHPYKKALDEVLKKNKLVNILSGTSSNNQQSSSAPHKSQQQPQQHSNSSFNDTNNHHLLDDDILQAANLLFNTFQQSSHNHYRNFQENLKKDTKTSDKRKNYDNQGSSEEDEKSEVKKKNIQDKDEEWNVKTSTEFDLNSQKIVRPLTPKRQKSNQKTTPASPKPKVKKETAVKKISKKSLRESSNSPGIGAAGTEMERQVSTDSSKSASNSGNNQAGRVCSFCAATSTPMWRHGPSNFPDLCNKCGVKNMRGRLFM